MQKHTFFPLLSVVAGGVGFFFNQQLQTTAVDPATLLVDSNSPYPSLLLALTIAVAVAFLLALKNGNSPQGVEDNFRKPPQLSLTLWTLGGSLLAVSTGHIIFTIFTQQLHTSSTMFSLPLMLTTAAVLAPLATIALLTQVKYLSKNQFPSIMGVLLSLPALASLPWLLICYDTNSTNPIVILYGYQIMALCTTVFALYCTTSLAYSLPHKGYPRISAFLSLLGCYLLLTSLSTQLEFYICGFQLAFALILFGNASVLLKNIYTSHRREKL